MHISEINTSIEAMHNQGITMSEEQPEAAAAEMPERANERIQSLIAERKSLHSSWRSRAHCPQRMSRHFKQSCAVGTRQRRKAGHRSALFWALASLMQIRRK